MAQQQSRSVFLKIITNFINSFRSRQIKGNFMGEDYMGTKYYEIPANPQLGKRRASRWYEPTDKENFEQELPTEWGSWLTGNRSEPPTKEEIQKNLAIAQMKKKNAAELELKYSQGNNESALAPGKSSSGNSSTSITETDKTGIKSFPMFEDYEIIPGKPRNTK